jgi:hypothetical protein
MPRGKKELTEQIIPYAASVEVEVGRGKTVAESVSAFAWRAPQQTHGAGLLEGKILT